jgi:ABC-type multidrug transport system fused ATPase/permease subunit
MKQSTTHHSAKAVYRSFIEILKYWAAAARPYRWYFVGIYVCYAIGIVAINILVPIYYQKIIDGMTIDINDLDAAARQSKYAVLLGYITIAGFLYALRIGAFRAGDWFFDHFRLGTNQQMEIGMFGDYLKHGRKFFVNNFAGSLLNDHRQMRGAFDVFMDHGTFTFFWWVIVFFGSLGALAFIFPLGAISIIVWFLIYLVVVVLVSRKKFKYERKVAELNSGMTGLLADNLSNAMTIKTFGAETRERNHYQQRHQVLHKARHQNKFWSRWRNGLQGILLIILDVGILIIGARAWMKGEISAGTIVLILYYSNNISQEVWNFSRMINAMTQAYADANKFMEHIRTKPDINDTQEAVPMASWAERSLSVMFPSITLKALMCLRTLTSEYVPERKSASSAQVARASQHLSRCYNAIWTSTTAPFWSTVQILETLSKTTCGRRFRWYLKTQACFTGVCGRTLLMVSLMRPRKKSKLLPARRRPMTSSWKRLKVTKRRSVNAASNCLEANGNASLLPGPFWRPAPPLL